MLGVDESAAGGDEPSGSGTTNGGGNLVVCLPGYLPNDAGTACVQQAVGDVVDTTKEVAGDKGLKQDDDDAHEGGHDVLYIFIILALCGYVGYSKGWHDKVLQKMRGTKIGVAMDGSNMYDSEMGTVSTENAIHLGGMPTEPLGAPP